MLQKSLGYSINKFRKFYSVPEKLSVSRKLKLQNLGNEVEQQLSGSKPFLIQYFAKMAN